VSSEQAKQGEHSSASSKILPSDAENLKTEPAESAELKSDELETVVLFSSEYISAVGAAYIPAAETSGMGKRGYVVLLPSSERELLERQVFHGQPGPTNERKADILFSLEYHAAIGAVYSSAVGPSGMGSKGTTAK